MTDEAHGATPDEAPVPPASTRWSEDAVADDDAPPPPFVPGRREPRAEATPRAEPTESEPFPFELPVDAPEHGDAGKEAAAAEEAAATDSAEDDFPFEQFDIEGRGEGTGTPDHPEAAATAEPEVGGGWSPADGLEQEREGVPAPEPEPDQGDPAAPAHAAPPATDAVEETAALLDRLADVLRSEGEAGVRRELDSPDRLTAVLAGILAGYLSGRS